MLVYISIQYYCNTNIKQVILLYTNNTIVVYYCNLLSLSHNIIGRNPSIVIPLLANQDMTSNGDSFASQS